MEKSIIDRFFSRTAIKKEAQAKEWYILAFTFDTGARGNYLGQSTFRLLKRFGNNPEQIARKIEEDYGLDEYMMLGDEVLPLKITDQDIDSIVLSNLHEDEAVIIVATSPEKVKKLFNADETWNAYINNPTENEWLEQVKKKSDQFKGNGKKDKQTAYAERLRAKVNADATTFDKENWSNIGKRPGGIYRSANKVVDKEAKMNIIGIAIDLWDRGIIGDNKLQALKDCKNEKIVQAEVLRIARANKLTDVMDRIGSNLDGQVETKDDKGYPRATGPSKTPADASGTNQRLPGNAEPNKSPASHDGTENRLPGIKEPKKEPWTGWKQKYDLRENDVADSPIPASSGGTDKRLPGVGEPEYHPKSGYPGTHTAKTEQPEIVKLLNSSDPEARRIGFNLVRKYYEDTPKAGMEVLEPFLNDPEVGAYAEHAYGILADMFQYQKEVEGKARKAQHRTPFELMKEKRKLDSQIEGMPHKVKIDPTKQENLGEPETQIKKQVHTTGGDMVVTPVTENPETMLNKDRAKDGESNPEVGIADVKNDYAPLGHPESSELQKSIEGMFTYPPDTEGAESKKKGQVGSGETSLVVEDFSLPGDSETKINWDLPKGERNEAPKTISADPTMTEQKSTSIPRENTFKGETNEKPGSSQLKEQIASKESNVKTTDKYGRVWNLPKNELCPECGQPCNVGDCNHKKLSDEEYKTLKEGKKVTSKDSVEVTCEQCKTAMTLTGEEFKEWADMGKTMCKCGNLVSVDLSDITVDANLFTGPPVSIDRERDLTGKKKKAKKGQVNWSKTASKTKEESVMDRFIAGKEMGREAQVITGDESGYGAKPEKKDETLEHDYDKDYREKMLDENKEDKTQDEREKELQVAKKKISGQMNTAEDVMASINEIIGDYGDHGFTYEDKVLAEAIQESIDRAFKKGISREDLVAEFERAVAEGDYWKTGEIKLVRKLLTQSIPKQSKTPENKTQDKQEKGLKKATHNIQIGDKVYMKEHEGTVLFRVDEIEPGETPEESTAYISELETGRYGQWIDLEDLVPAFPETGISGKKADCGHCGNPGDAEACDGEQCPYCAEYMGEDASEELHDMGEAECPHCRKVVEAIKKEGQSVGKSIVEKVDDYLMSAIKYWKKKGYNEKDALNAAEDMTMELFGLSYEVYQYLRSQTPNRTAQKAPKVYDSMGRKLFVVQGRGRVWALKDTTGNTYFTGTPQEIEAFIDKKVEQGEFSTSKTAQLEEKNIVKKVDDYLGERIDYWKKLLKNEDEVLERAENETMGYFGLSNEVYQYLRSQTPDRPKHKGQLSETDPMQMETGKPTSEIEKIKMSRERVDKPIDVIMTPSIERSEGAGSPIDPTFMAEQIVRSLKNGHLHTAQEGFNHMIRSTKDITSVQIEELKGLMAELGYDVIENAGVEGIS